MGLRLGSRSGSQVIALQVIALVMGTQAGSFCDKQGAGDGGTRKGSPKMADGGNGVVIRVRMPLDEVLGLLRHQKVECKYYPTSEVAGKLGVDMTTYVIESRCSTNALMILAVQKDKKSPMRVEQLIWYKNWSSLKKYRGIDLVNARGQLLSVRRAAVTVDRLKRFQDSDDGSDYEFKAPANGDQK